MVKNLPTNTGDIRDLGSIPGLGRSPGGGHGSPLQYSCLENPMDGGAWQATVHGVAKSRTRMSDFIQGERSGELWPFERFLIGDSHTALGDLQSDRENVRHTWLFVALWTIAQKAPLSMEFSRQEYWSG